MRISCVAVVPRKHQTFVGIKDFDRGIILPGGKFEPDRDKDYHACAERELREETGIETWDGQFLFSTFYAASDYFVHFFLFTKTIYHPNKYEGEFEIVDADWGNLLDSEFRAPYRLLQDILRKVDY